MSNIVISPTGRILKEYLKEYNISQKDLSLRTGISEKHISNVIKGKSGLTEDFAIKLESVLVGVPASYWLNYEAKYKELEARRQKRNKLSTTKLKEISKRFHFPEVFKGLNLTILEQAEEMLKILKISDFDNFDQTYSNTVISFMEDGGEKEASAIWLGLCESEIEIQNTDLSSCKYSKTRLEEELPKFKLLARNEITERSIEGCRKLCNQLGIYLVVCDAIINAKIRGALCTYNNNPAVYLSGRFKTHDHIWFAFIHEIAHLLLHYRANRSTIISYENEDIDISKEELEANKFARDFFIDSSDFIVFIKQNDYSENMIRQFALSQDVLPGIVVSAMQHDKIIGFDQLNHLK